MLKTLKTICFILTLAIIGLLFWIFKFDRVESSYIPPLVNPMGEVYKNDNSTSTVITTANTWTRASGILTLGHNLEFTIENNRLKYTGKYTKNFHCGVTIVLGGTADSDTVSAIIYKNGTVNGNNEFTGGTALTNGTISLKLRAGTDISSTAIHAMTTLSTNDTLELAVRNNTDTDNFLVQNLNLFCVGETFPKPL